MFKTYVDNIKTFVQKYFYGHQINRVHYPKTYIEDIEFDNKYVLNSNIDEKQLRIKILLYIKQIKNIYYKYTDTTRFNKILYDSFVDEDNFDGGNTAFDDDDNVKIFDKYIIDYIKSRNEIITYLQCKNKHINFNKKLTDLNDIRTIVNTIDIVFIMDMSDKDIFDYCYSLVKDNTNCITAQAVLFSMVFKYNDDYVRIKLNSYKKSARPHPYLIIESAMI